MFYFVVCCMFRGSSEMKCPVSGSRRLMLVFVRHVFSHDDVSEAHMGILGL